MKNLLLAALLLTAACGALASDKPKIKPAEPTLRLTLLPQSDLTTGKPVTVMLKLSSIKDRLAVTDDDLTQVHTRKLHLLVVDATLTDYQHIHPEATGTPGLYRFTFTPKLSGGYRAFADVTPKATGKQEFDIADLGTVRAQKINESVTSQSTVDNYHFTLTFEQPPVAGDETMGTVSITDKSGAPVTSLESVMGAYAHIVGFSDDLHTLLHVHPMGEEPKNASDRGGPQLMFHIAPAKPGFIKLFVQVKIHGKDIFAPFGVKIGEEKK